MSDFGKKNYTAAELGGEAVNFLRFVLSTNISSSATVLTVTPDPTVYLPDGSSNAIFVSVGLPSVDEEVMRVLKRDATTITVKRNVDGKGAFAHNASDFVRMCFSAEIMNTLADVISDQGSKIVPSAVASIDLEAYKIVTYNSSGQFQYAKANTLETSLVVGITLDNFSQGATAYALKMGEFNNPNWYFNTQKRLYLSATSAGDLSEFQPAEGSNYYSVCCGHTKTNTTINFEKPSLGNIAIIQ